MPFGFGVVELDEGLRVVTRFTGGGEALVFDQRVHLVLEPVATDDDGTVVLAWSFAPGEASQ